MSHFGIKSIEIENFKGIGESPVKIDFRAITLLFGQNSAGKSTILHAMTYLEDLLNYADSDAEVFTKATKTNLGGFQNIVHKKDLEREIRIKLTINLSDDGLPSYYSTIDDVFTDDVDSLASDVNDCFVEVKIVWDSVEKKSKVSSFSTGINDRKVATLVERFSSEDNSNKIYIENFDYAHPVNDSVIYEDDIQSLITNHNDGLKLSCQKLVIPVNLKSVGKGNCCLFDQNTVNDLELDFSLADLMTQVILGPLDAAKHYLKYMRYIGPVRSAPSKAYTPPAIERPYRWASGLGAWDMLLKHISSKHKDFDFTTECNKTLNEIVNKWLSDDYLKTGYNLVLNETLKVDNKITQDLRNLANNFDDIEADELISLINDLKDKKVYKEVKLLDTRTGTEVSFGEVGIGISQVLPVIVGAITPCHILAVEQPELHLHPALQCNLADLFISRKNLSENRVHLLETHSEHMMLRFLRRIREFSEEENQSDEFILLPEDIAVYYVDATPNGTEMTKLNVTEDGDFDQRWPNGFFNERAKELF